MRTKKDIKIDNAVMNTLDLLDNLKQEKPRAGFYQRLDYRIEHPEQENKIEQIPLFNRVIRFAATPAMVAACIAFGIFIGLETNKTTSSTELDVLVDTYNLSVSETPQLFETESN